MSAGLPPGQSVAALHRFGLPEFAGCVPVVAIHPVITVSGAVRRPTQLDVAELTALPVRVERRSDLHCVTTWSARDLWWQGVPMRAAHELLVARTPPRSTASWLGFVGLDGFRSVMSLADALAEDVLLADTLNGVPLTVQNGAPLRLVAPAHYGYKSVRHLCAIEYLTVYDSGSAAWKGHPRGRVVLEERSRFLPGRLWRPLWRALLPRVRQIYQSAPRTDR